VPENRIYDGFQQDIIAKLIEEQKRKYEKWVEGDTDESDIPYIVCIFDDVISEKTLRYEELLNQIVYSGRHYFMFIVVCSQDCKGLPPGVRQNADLVAVTWQTQERAIESITRDYADIFEDKDLFKAILKVNTVDHGMIVIDQTEAKYSADEMFFYDRAEEEVEPYALGDADFWKESGNDWKDQLRKYQNVQALHDIEPDEWRRRGEARIKAAQKRYQEEEEEMPRWKTNQIGLAPPKLRELHEQTIQKKFGGNAYADALKKLDEKGFFNYYPPPPGVLPKG
jgi:hypothetical protein